MKTKRTLWMVLAVVLVGGGVFAALKLRGPKTEKIEYQTTKVDRGNVVARVTATGTLSALVTVQVGSQVSGRLLEIRVDFNSRVKKGEVIAKLDPRLFEAAVEQARANLTAAQSSLTKANVRAVEASRTLERTQALAKRQLVAPADVDAAEATAQSAKAEVAAAQGEIARARASLNQAQINLAYTTIVSPIDGVVISRDVDVGQTVAASLQAPTLFTIAEDLAKMQVDTSVAEADVGKLSPGMTATFTVDAFPGERFRGTVRQIRNAPKTVQNVVTYNAVVSVDNAGLKLRPGMTANVTFVYAEQQDVLRLPNAALRFRPSEVLMARARKLTSGGGEGRGPEAPPSAGAPATPAAPTASAASAPQVAEASSDGGARAEGGRERRRRREEGAPDRRLVWVMRGGLEPEPVFVQLGVSDGTNTELRGDTLKEGDEVVVEAIGGPQPAAAPQGGGGGRGGGRGLRGIL
jgi:HlyD family secretion protein